MTLVNAETGEVIATVTADEAREMTDRIKVTVEGAWLLIKEAYETRCWAVLGYQSWDDYCTREFGTSRLKLPREERQEVVASLRDSGLSLRAISAATGLHHSTVAADLDAAPVGNPTPDAVTGTDGKSYPVKDRIEDAKFKHPVEGSGKSRAEMAQKIATAQRMADEGYTSRQISDALGFANVKTFFNFRDSQGIHIPADAIVGKTKVHDSNRIMETLASDAANVAAGADLIDYAALDPERIEEWIGSLTSAISSLTTIRRKIRELTR